MKYDAIQSNIIRYDTMRSVGSPLGIIQIDEKRPRFGPFFAENQFSPANEAVLMGLVVRKCHFDVTACAEARRLAQKAERSLRDLSALLASRRALRAGWITLSHCSSISGYFY